MREVVFELISILTAAILLAFGYYWLGGALLAWIGIRGFRILAMDAKTIGWDEAIFTMAFTAFISLWIRAYVNGRFF